MEEHELLALLALLLFAGLGGLIYLTGPKLAGWSKRRASVTGALFLSLGIFFAYFGYSVGLGQARTTLYEARFDGSRGLQEGDPVPVREHRFAIEHPGVEHQLTLWPRVASILDEATFTARAEIVLYDPAGAVVLQRALQFAPEGHEHRRQDASGVAANRPVIIRYTWEAQDLAFTPRKAGNYTLQVMPTVADIPSFYLRIMDPKKTDGTRDASLRE